MLFGQRLGWGCVHRDSLYWELYTAEPSECCKGYRISAWAGKCWYCRLAEHGNAATRVGSQREGVNEENSTIFSPFPHRLQISWCCVCICSAQGLLCVRRGVPDCLSSYQNIYALIWDTWWELIASCFRERFSDNLTGGIVSLCETQTRHYPSARSCSRVRSCARSPWHRAGSCQPFCDAMKLYHKFFRANSSSSPSLLTFLIAPWNLLVTFQSSCVNELVPFNGCERGWGTD